MIAVENLALRAGAFALPSLTFHVPTGAYAVLMGRTGSGKTTLLEAICGLNRPRAGRVVLMGRDVTKLKPAQRDIGYVPQDRALFSTMSVRENLGFSLSIRGWSADAIIDRVDQLADLLDIRRLLPRRPVGLSGGESQRVALGRALAFGPGVLLLDEPLSALDDRSRSDMHDLLKNVRTHTGVTTLHVTHHLDDAERLADHVLLIDDGVIRPASIESLRTPRERRDRVEG